MSRPTYDWEWDPGRGGDADAQSLEANAPVVPGGRERLEVLVYQVFPGCESKHSSEILVIYYMASTSMSTRIFKPTRASSSQMGGQTMPNSIEVVNLVGVGSSWEDRLARARVTVQTAHSVADTYK